MTITHGASPDGLPAVGDYISEDFLQILEVFLAYFNFKRNIERFVSVRGSSLRLRQLASD